MVEGVVGEEVGIEEVEAGGVVLGKEEGANIHPTTRSVVRLWN